MVPLPLPHSAPQSTRGAIELYEGHLATTRSIEHAPWHPRSYDSPTNTGTNTGTASALYILLGVLISLCITAPIVAHFRKKQKKNVSDYIQRAKRTTMEVEAKAAEMAVLQRRQDHLIQEQGGYQASQQRHETRLRDATSQIQTLQQQTHNLEQSIRDREGAVTIAERERDMAERERDTAEAEAREARAETLEARQSHSTTLEMVLNLEREVQRKEEDLRTLQWRYDHVDQESRRLMCEIASGQS
jgi:chromosome segregation ATPase